MYWLLLLTLVALSQELVLERWNGNTWVNLYTCSGSCIYGTVVIDSSERFRIRVNSGYYVRVTFQSADVLGEENLDVYARNDAPASDTAYTDWYRRSTPVTDTGACGTDRYYYIVNRNTFTDADLIFNMNEFTCSATTTTTTSTSTSGSVTTGSGALTTGSVTTGRTTTSTSTSGVVTTGGSNAPRVAGRYYKQFL
jgi:hypothetical protein